MRNTSTVDAGEIAAVIRKSGLRVDETVAIPGRAAVHRPVPETLAPEIAARLTTEYKKGLYSHQADTIRAVIAGTDVCLATPTASGKSLVFMTAAAQLLLQDSTARVLALYPAKALIQDQLEKWEAFLNPFGLRVGYVDGSVPMGSRAAILASSRVVAMTPDVAHAWLMSHLGDREAAAFLRKLKLLVLDEAHVYDGAFGTNMAYFLRRLGVAASPHRMICSTATVGAPAEFMRQLTGREMTVVDAEADGSQISEKTLLLARLDEKGAFDRLVELLVNLVDYRKARFLAFGDSRKAVERIVAAILRHDTSVNEQADADDDVDGDETDDDAPETIRSSRPALEHVLPFRAGYESEDRLAIQKALTRGSLAGVVSTSALELGLDIGDLDVVVLLNTPSSMKAFRQRIGRAGRRRPAVCILLDDRDQMRPLVDYVARPPEPSWLYLENRYIQYSNAMCAAAELQVRGTRSVRDVSYPGLPESFIRFVENELNPTEAVPPDLYGLKQKAQANPHYEFPIRSAAEPNFKVEDKFSRPLGTLSYAQVLREAYPGAIYYYMAQPHRVYAFDFKKAQIRVKRAKHFTTKPIAETMAFPDFKAGILAGWKSDEGFVCEAELQVSERVKGFTEQRGRTKTPYEYGPTSIYSQKPLTRFFQTTGVCWAFPRALNRTEPVAQHLLRAFSWACGIQERDLGYAFFKSNQGPFDAAPVQGTVIFDSVNGSLRLTERLAAQFQAVVQAAVDAEEDSAVLADLMTLRSLAGNLLSAVATSQPVPGAQQGEWVVLIARGQPAIYLNGLEGAIEVTVLGYRYTPLGIQYELKALTEPKFELHKEQHRHGVKTSVTKDGAVKWMVSAEHIQPVNGTTRFMRVNLMNGEELEGEPDVTA